MVTLMLLVLLLLMMMMTKMIGVVVWTQSRCCHYRCGPQRGEPILVVVMPI